MMRIAFTLLAAAACLSVHAQESSGDKYSKTLAGTMVLTADAENLRVQAQIDQLRRSTAPSASMPAAATDGAVSDKVVETPSPRVTGSFGQGGDRYYSVALPDGNTDLARHPGQTLKGGEWRVGAIGGAGPTFTRVSKVKADGSR